MTISSEFSESGDDAQPGIEEVDDLRIASLHQHADLVTGVEQPGEERLAQHDVAE